MNKHSIEPWKNTGCAFNPTGLIQFVAHAQTDGHCVSTQTVICTQVATNVTTCHVWCSLVSTKRYHTQKQIGRKKECTVNLHISLNKLAEANSRV